MQTTIKTPPYDNNSVDIAVGGATERTADRESEKITLMGLLRNDDAAKVVGWATFIFLVLTLVLSWTLLSDIRREVRLIRTETETNTLHVNRMEERLNFLEKRIERIENIN